MHIRRYAPEDADQLVTLLEEFLAYAGTEYAEHVIAFEDVPAQKRNAYAKEILEHFANKENSRFLVADDDAVVGYILGCIKEQPFKLAQKTGHIQSFFVSESYRGKGIGKQLYEELKDWFRQQDCDSMDLDVYDGNRQTQKTYEKWGFVVTAHTMKQHL